MRRITLRSSALRIGIPRSATDDLAEAQRLIEKHYNWRRKEELEDAERVIGK
jgi:hypothetical protein